MDDPATSDATRDAVLARASRFGLTTAADVHAHVCPGVSLNAVRKSLARLVEAGWLAPLLPPNPPHPRGGRPFSSDRACFDGVVYLARNGLRWRSMPRCFSPQNVWKMRQFFVAYAAPANLSQPVRELEPPAGVLHVPWGHNMEIIFKVKDPEARLWYVRATKEFGWSRSVLEHQIETDAFRRQGQAVTNFDRALPAPQSDLARETLKDPYSFQFLTLAEEHAEADLQRGLVAHVRQFLLELGAGFAFVGEQVHLEVGGEDFYLDLLFYHLKLRCYVVFDLKARRFTPEAAGKMNFYLSAVDDLLRHPADQPSVGVVLCKARNKVVAEYALRDIEKPLAVTTYVTRLVESLPEELKRELDPPADDPPAYKPRRPKKA